MRKPRSTPDSPSIPSLGCLGKIRNTLIILLVGAGIGYFARSGCNAHHHRKGGREPTPEELKQSVIPLDTLRDILSKHLSEQGDNFVSLASVKSNLVTQQIVYNPHAGFDDSYERVPLVGSVIEAWNENARTNTNTIKDTLQVIVGYLSKDVRYDLRETKRNNRRTIYLDIQAPVGPVNLFSSTLDDISYDWFLDAVDPKDKAKIAEVFKQMKDQYTRGLAAQMSFDFIKRNPQQASQEIIDNRSYVLQILGGLLASEPHTSFEVTLQVPIQAPSINPKMETTSGDHQLYTFIEGGKTMPARKGVLEVRFKVDGNGLVYISAPAFYEQHPPSLD